MCGICGILDIEGEITEGPIRKMNEIMKHRGPDDDGILTDGRVGLGHVRLSIIDLTEMGHQPMANDDGTMWIVYNGEIYNYVELREELVKKGFVFRSEGDTEVLLRAYECWGEKCLQKLNGMFSFVIYDKKKKMLFGARDRFGIKPFHYYHDGSRFLFASEIKSILSAGIEPLPDHEIIYDYLVYQVMDHREQTFFKGITKLLPGHFMKVRLKDVNIEIERWWELKIGYEKSAPEEVIKGFYDRFEDSVRLRLRSDVPVGSCLSGGLDSSSVVSTMVRLLGKSENVKTFSSVYSVDFPGNEKKYIRKLVKRFGVSGFETEPTADDIIEDLEKLIYYQEEPFNGLSPLAQWEVMKLAREKGMKVLLDGQGSDEILAGYLFYFGFYFSHLLKRLRMSKLCGEMSSYKKLHGSGKYPRDQMRYMFIPGFIKEWSKKRKAYYLDGNFMKKHRGSHHFSANLKVRSLRSALRNSVMYGLVKLLRFEDRCSMAHSIETRVPFLDHRLVEFVFGLSDDMKIRDGRTKFVLREAMKKDLPRSIYERHDKVGFAAPEDIWLKNDRILEYVTGILTSKRTASRGIFDGEGIKRLLGNYRKGDSSVVNIIWSLVILELWFRKYIDDWKGGA